jgi:serine/threonine-protein kinase RsbW
VSPPSDQDNRPRRGPTRRGSIRPTARPAATMEVFLAAEWVAPSIARDRVRRWLTTHRWPPAHLDDLVLAISEAVSNSVEHGYGISADDTTTRSAMTAPSGTIEVHGHVMTNPHGVRYVEFTIRDHGQWIPHAACYGSRGHGMAIMRACAAEVIIDHSAGGTTVVLRSRPLPRLPLRSV